jgi:hypothetical protein
MKMRVRRNIGRIPLPAGICSPSTRMFEFRGKIIEVDKYSNGFFQAKDGTMWLKEELIEIDAFANEEEI